MSGNGRLYRPGDIPPAALDTSSSLRLRSFSWKPTDRPQGALIADRSGSLRVQLANNTISILVLPADLSTGDYRAGDKVTFRAIRAHCTTGAGSHSAFVLACSLQHLAPVDHRPPQHPRVNSLVEPTPEESDRIQRVLKLAPRAFPTPSRGIVAVRGPS